MDEENVGEDQGEKKEEVTSEPEINEIKHEEPAKPLIKTESVTDKIRKNPFILSTLVCGALAALLLVVMISGGSITGNVVSKERAGNNLMEYLNNIVDSDVELIDIVDNGALYEATVKYNGRQIPIYITKDGLSYTSNLIPLSNPTTNEPAEDTPVDVPKSDNPIVELFIWSYCPYGVLAQGPMAEVASLLAEEANFKAFMYYDGHGDYETQQNKIQACIQEKDSANYWAYAAGFVDDIYPVCSQSKDIECDRTESIKLMNSLGIDSDAIMSCVESEGADLIKEDAEYAQSLGVTGSPTVIVNGAKVNVGRNAEAYKGAVCEAFNDAPEECGTVLDSTSAAASGNC